MAKPPRLTIRRDFFLPMFGVISDLLPELYGDRSFDEDDATVLASLYFIMNDSYKKWRLADGHFTNDYKKAGVTIAAIMAMRPFRPKDKDDRQGYFANQIFAMFCAVAILNKPISAAKSADRDQYYMWLDTLRFPSTQGFLSNATAGADEFAETAELHLSFSEISSIDAICQQLKLRCAAFDLEQRLHNLDDDP